MSHEKIDDIVLADEDIEWILNTDPDDPDNQCLGIDNTDNRVRTLNYRLKNASYAANLYFEQLEDILDNILAKVK